MHALISKYPATTCLAAEVRWRLRAEVNGVTCDTDHLIGRLVINWLIYALGPTRRLTNRQPPHITVKCPQLATIPPTSRHLHSTFISHTTTCTYIDKALFEWPSCQCFSVSVIAYCSCRTRPPSRKGGVVSYSCVLLSCVEVFGAYCFVWSKEAQLFTCLFLYEGSLKLADCLIFFTWRPFLTNNRWIHKTSSRANGFPDSDLRKKSERKTSLNSDTE